MKKSKKQIKKKMGIFPKTFLATLLLFSIMIIMIHGLIYVMMNQTYTNKKNQQAKDNLEELSSLTTNKSGHEILKICESFATQKNVNLNLKIDGNVRHIQGFTGADIVTDGLLGSKMIPLVNNEQLGSILVLNLEIQDAEGKSVVIQMLSNVESLKEAREATLEVLPYSLLISTVVALLFAYFYSRLMVMPIRRMAETTKKMQPHSGW